MTRIPPKKSSPFRAIGVDDVVHLTSTSRPTIWRWAKTDPTFPKPFRVSPQVTRWNEADVIGWLERKQIDGKAA